MKLIETKIPDQFDREIDALVKEGWFQSRAEVPQEAVRRFLECHWVELMERFVREDIEWGLRGRT